MGRKRSIATSSVVLCGMAGAFAAGPLAGQARAGWIPTAANTYDYLAPANWTGGDINDDFPSTLTLLGTQTATFGSGRTTPGDLNFNYAGNFGLTLRANGVANQTLVLGGNVNLNTTGGTTANVTIGSATANQNLNVNLGGVTRTFTVAGNRTLTLTNAVSNGGLAKSESGTLVLSGTNTFGGGLTLNAGTLRVTNVAALGDAAGSLTLNGGTLMAGVNASSGFSLGGATRSITVSANTNLHGYQNDGTYTIDSQITGAGRLILGRTDWGKPTFVFSKANTHAGTTVGTANIELRNTHAAGTSDLMLSNYGEPIIRLRDDNSVTYAFSAISASYGHFTVNVDRLSTGTDRTLTIAAINKTFTDGVNNTIHITGGNGYRLAVTALDHVGGGWYTARLRLNPTTANVTVGTMNARSGVIELDGTATDNHVTGTISGGSNVTEPAVGSIVKSGTGTWILSGNNTYGGQTLISNGLLVVNGSIASSRGVTVTGGTLGGKGSIAGAVTLNTGGHIAPGDSPGTLTTGAQTWAGGASYDFELKNATGPVGAGFDTVAINGALTVNATSSNKFTVAVSSLDTLNAPGNASNFNSAANYHWLIADATSAISSFNADAFKVTTTAFTNPHTGTWAVTRGDSILGGDSTQLYLTYTAVPEPATLAVFGAAGLFALRRRRTPRILD